MSDSDQTKPQQFTGTLADPCWGCGAIATTFNCGWPVCPRCKRWNVGVDPDAHKKMEAYAA